MNPKNYIYLALISCIFFASNDAVGREITINGTLQLQDLSPTQQNVYVFQFGAPYYTEQPGVDWTLLGETRSDSNGVYSITLEVGVNTELAVVVPYAYPRYSLIKRLEIGAQTNLDNVMITLPSPPGGQLAYQARVYENGVEIDYSIRVYDIVIVPLNFSDQAIWIQLSDLTYPLIDNRKFSAPNGEYRVHCLLASPGLGTGASNTEVSFVLPLTSDFLDCNFQLNQ